MGRKKKSKKIAKIRNFLDKTGAKEKERKGLLSGLFLAKFFGIYFVLTAFIGFFDLSPLTAWLASISATPIEGLESIGNAVAGEGKRFIISNECTGLVSVSILAAVIFSLRKPEIKKKAVLFVGGACLLLLANIPRIMLVLWVGKAGFDAEVVHVATWFLMSALILAVWYYGTKRYAGINNFDELL